MGGNWLFWIGFLVFVLTMLALDLGVFHRKVQKVPVREAVIWTAIWITLAMIFMGVIYIELGKTKALEFLTGYVIEYALSVDNIFVFILIFSFFQVDERYQHKVLFWGIIGALIMRGIFIFTGVALINRFHWIIYIFGSFLIFTGVRMLIKEYATPDSIKGNHLPNSPAHQLYADAAYRLGKHLTAGVGLEMQSKWYIYTDAAHSNISQEGFTLFHARLSCDFSIGRLPVSISVNVKNLGNKQYIAFTEPDPDGNSYQPSARREIFAGLRINF